MGIKKPCFMGMLTSYEQKWPKENRNIKWQNTAAIGIIKAEKENEISEEIITESVSDRPQRKDQETSEHERTKTTIHSYLLDHRNKKK